MRVELAVTAVRACAGGSVRRTVETRVPVSVSLSGRPVPSETRVVSAAAQVLVITTSLPSPEAPYTLHSVYVGDRSGPTSTTHLLLAPGGREAALSQREHPAHELPVAEDERRLCLYDHLQHLLGALVAADLEPQTEIADQAVAVADR